MLPSRIGPFNPNKVIAGGVAYYSYPRLLSFYGAKWRPWVSALSAGFLGGLAGGAYVMMEQGEGNDKLNSLVDPALNLSEQRPDLLVKTALSLGGLGLFLGSNDPNLNRIGVAMVSAS